MTLNKAIQKLDDNIVIAKDEGEQEVHLPLEAAETILHLFNILYNNCFQEEDK